MAQPGKALDCYPLPAWRREEANIQCSKELGGSNPPPHAYLLQITASIHYYSHIVYVKCDPTINEVAPNQFVVGSRSHMQQMIQPTELSRR